MLNSKLHKNKMTTVVVKMHKIKLMLEKGDGTDIWGWVPDIGFFHRTLCPIH